MVGLLSLESCCGRPKTRYSVLEGLRDRKLEDMSSWIRYSYVFKVSACYERNTEQRMIREVEYHQRRVGGLLMN